MQAVLEVHNVVIKVMNLGVNYVDLHKLANKVILESLKKGFVLVGFTLSKVKQSNPLNLIIIVQYKEGEELIENYDWSAVESKQMEAKTRGCCGGDGGPTADAKWRS
ncbi:hypothetical protein Pint_22640 [Pistacia integerrima]|uniref:Uncharacterized protein n=1 Tax=Pistacia integerrima TaxID=434235 RepID=A0ACC0YJL6_9ROSI|nr:hypothetical protein Pint_22640 [Pistacia integerrima]